MNNIAERIKECVTIEDILTRNGYKTDRYRRIPCPIHNGKNKGSFSYNKSSFFCFSCQEHGDVITLVQKLFNIEFKSAISKINNDFSLGFTYKKPTAEEMKCFARMVNDRVINTQRKDEARQDYLEKVNLYAYLRRKQREYFPKDPEEEYHPVFIYASQHLAELENYLDENIGSY